MNIITDLRTLTAIATRYNLTFDYKHKYITNDNGITWLDYKQELYKIKYLDGCFYPYIIKMKEL